MISLIIQMRITGCILRQGMSGRLLFGCHTVTTSAFLSVLYRFLSNSNVLLLLGGGLLLLLSWSGLRVEARHRQGDRFEQAEAGIVNDGSLNCVYIYRIVNLELLCEQMVLDSALYTNNRISEVSNEEVAMFSIDILNIVRS